MKDADKELLALAAKAAGYDLKFEADGTAYKCQEKKRWIADPWNPLAHDGDALRLATRLCISIVYEPECSQTEANTGALDMDPDAIEKWEQDEYAATRRAIVRAAAELGRTK